MASAIYPSFKTGLMSKSFNLNVTDTIKLVLVTGYSYDSSHTKWSDVYTYEITGTGYTKGNSTTVGGATVTTAVAAYNTTYAVFEITSGAPAGSYTWSSATVSATGALLVDTSAGGGGANSLLIAYIDFGGTQSSSNGNFTVDWSTQTPAGAVLSIN